MKKLRDGTGKRSGFTLVEMVAASIILAMLMSVLVMVTRSGLRQAKRAEEIRASHPETSVLEDQIVRDLRNSDGFSPLVNGVTLFGALSTDPSTGRGTHQLVRVTYQVGDVAGLKVLVRTEQSSGGISHRRAVWMGADEFFVEPAGPPLPADSQRTGGLSPMPSEMTVTLNANGRRVLNCRVAHHREFQ